MSLLLVDGTALVYRAHYAFAKRPLTAPSGEMTSVLHGFLASLLQVIETQRPSHLAIFFDRKPPTFRHQMYADYKANRKPMPEEIVEQLPRLREVVDAWGVTVLEMDGFEADDLMATVGAKAGADIGEVWHYTGDKDFMQLLDERTSMLKPGRRGDDVTKLTAGGVREQYGLDPVELIDVFALSGDASDNIPGAPGIGAKTALKLILEFASLDSLIAAVEGGQADSITPRLRRIVAENREQILLSRRLFTIDRDVPCVLDYEAMRTTLPTSAAATKLLLDLGLRQARSRIDRIRRLWPEVDADADTDEVETPVEEVEEAPAAAAAEVDPEEEIARRGYGVCATEKALKKWLGTLPDGAPLAVDTETDGLRPDRARLVGISLAAAGVAAVYIPVLGRGEAPAEGTGGEGELFAAPAETTNLAWVRRVLAPCLADARRCKIGQNLKFDEWILTRHGLPLEGERFDTMVAAWLLDPGRQRFGLDELVGEHLGETPIPYSALFDPKDRVRDILTVDPLRLALYAAEDADVTFRLHEVLSGELDGAGLRELFRDLEMPLSALLFAIERNGIRIDTDFLGGLHDRFAADLESLTGRIHEAAGGEFNVQSPKQLAEVLFEKIGLKPVRKTSTGWSTDVNVLTALAEQHPVPALVLEYRQLAKLQGTYVDALPKLVNPESRLIHTSYNQAVAATGRLSSSDPNLQNIPIRSETGRLIRQAFVPRDEGNVFLSADYSQIELRLLAHLSGDAELTNAFRSGGDVHRRTAALIAGVEEDEVSSRMRSRAKAINFGVIYGMGARALGKQINVKTREAAAFIESYFETYPGVKAFIERTKERARIDGAVSTLLGRRRLLPDIGSSNNRVRSFQERVAVNTPIQGTAADLIKLAMLHLDAVLRENESGALILLQVHDELVLEVPRDEITTVRSLVRECMESVMELSVPLVVDMHEGADWAAAHD